MTSDSLKPSSARVRSTFLVWVLMTSVLLVATDSAYAAFVEEDIGTNSPPSAASKVARPRVTTVAPTKAQPRNLAEPAVEPDLRVPVLPPAQPHASFPYSIRPGDTLGAIAAQFGIAVADLRRINRIGEDTGLIVGQTLRIPNPFLARERELTNEIDSLSRDKQASAERAARVDRGLAAARAQVQDLTASNGRYVRDNHALPWWRTFGLGAATAAVLMLGTMLLALSEWWMLHGRFRAVAEMNESLRRLDYKYRAALAKAELRLQELYGRRRRGLQEGLERPKIPEEVEIEQLNRQLKELLEEHLARLGPPSESVRRARWRERISGIGSPVEARSARR
jgi:LysM repeat protein